MGLPAVGAVVLIPFPYADFAKLKRRPALVVAKAEFDNLIVCQITSKPYTSQKAILLPATAFETGGLALPSFVRPDKLFTIDGSLVEQELGNLKKAYRSQVLQSLRKLFTN